MDKLKTDGDIMVYLRNVRIALQKISAQTGLSINISATPDGYAYVCICWRLYGDTIS
nr:hypothetical protein [uncultured Blautia sp.]